MQGKHLLFSSLEIMRKTQVLVKLIIILAIHAYSFSRNVVRENQVTYADAVVENAGHTSITIQDKSTEQTLTHSQEISTDSSKESQGSQISGGQSCDVPTKTPRCLATQ